MTAHAARQCDAHWSGERPRVSVIIVFLNAERFIAEAIESALAQDYRDFELILVDDGSAATCASLAGPTRSDSRRWSATFDTRTAGITA